MLLFSALPFAAALIVGIVFFAIAKGADNVGAPAGKGPAPVSVIVCAVPMRTPDFCARCAFKSDFFLLLSFLFVIPFISF